MGLTRPRAEQIFNLDYKQATRAVTTTNVTLAGGAPAQVDGVTLSVNDRILVTGQATASQNGLYLVATLGSGSNGTWTRTTDGNDTGEIEAGMIVMVTEGSVYADTQWKLITDNPIDIGITSLTFTQNYSANSIAGGSSNVTVYSNANVVISSAGTANVLTVSNAGAYVSGLISATGNVTGNYILGNGSQLTGLPATYGDSNVVTLLASFGSNSISTTGDITAGNINSPHADLAEMYVADADYPPGIVVEFGGDLEITVARTSHSTAVAGITSTNPSYLMNSAQSGQYVIPVALVGRVPCQVIGTIVKGDRLVASNYMGVAERLDPDKYQPGCIVGKALENYDSETIGLIEVAVGRT
jgi:hypothetical protein